MAVSLRSLLSVALTALGLTFCAEPALGRGRVYVFGERSFPKAGGALALAPLRIVAVLREHGVEASVVDEAALEQSAWLEEPEASVLVLPCGNAFPKAALPNLQRFHKRGGSLVLSGVPFTHPCERIDGKWKDLGHQSHVGHGDQGMGTGSFGSADPQARWTLRVPESPLALPEDWFHGKEGRTQWLEPGSLDPKDEVLPLLLTGRNPQEAKLAAALVRHRCEGFSGACDVWLGHQAGGEEEKDVFLGTQLMVRGVLWCLREKGELGAEDFEACLAALNQKAFPAPLPGGLVAEESARPWGDTFLPKSHPPARQLDAVVLKRLSAEVRVALTCLQGLTSRSTPSVWLIHTPADRFWLEWHQKQGHIDGFVEEPDWKRLFSKHKDRIKGVVVADPDLYRGDLLAVNVAACEDWIVASPALAEELGLEVRMDLRGRFQTYAEGLEWLWETYKGRFNRHLCDYMQPGRLQNGNFAYAYQWKAPMVWISGSEDENAQGADRCAERRVVAKVFSEMPVNIPIMGFPAAGEGVGIGEPPGVALASRYGKGLVCTDHMLNAGVMSGVRVAELKQPEQPPVPALDRDKIYVALVMSDGDNQNAWHLFFRKYFESPSHGKFPLAYGIGPAIRELQPALAQWYFQRATPTTEFIADVSGAGYMQPDHWGEAYVNQAQVLSGFLRWTAALLPPLGLRSVRTVHGEDGILSEYAKALPFCHSLFADMGCYSGHRGYPNLTYTLPEGMPVFRAVTTWRNYGSGFMGEIREQVGNTRPAFVNGFVHCWTFGPDQLESIVRNAGPDVVFVTPSQLAALYRQAAASAGTRAVAGGGAVRGGGR
ncbi:MAG: hypothetical protein RLZZ244_2849 [Verrucomicrobiota bacterium]